MAIEITAADRDRIIRDLAAAGKPAPDWVTADPKLNAVYQKAAAGSAGRSTSTKPAKPAAARPAPASRPARAAAGKKSPARTTRSSPGSTGTARTGRGHSRSGGRARRSSRTPAGMVPVPQVLTRAANGSAAGGLLLAAFLYPLTMATLRYGAGGPLMWIRAKFFNKVPNEPGGGVRGAATGVGDTLDRTKPGQPASPPAAVPAWDPAFPGYVTDQMGGIPV